MADDNIITYARSLRLIHGTNEEVYETNIQNSKNTMRLQPGELTNARAAFLDILPELVPLDEEGNVTDASHLEDAQRIYETLFLSGPKSGAGIKQTPESREYEISQTLQQGFPSHFEGGNNERKSHGILLRYLQKELYQDQDINRIANIIYKPYVVIDGGGSTKLVFTKKELSRRNLTKGDMERSVRYFMYRQQQLGNKMNFIAGTGINTSYSDYGKGVEALKKINADVLAKDSTSSIFPAVIRNANGIGVQVVIMAGNSQNKTQARIVGRMHVTDGETGETTPLQYNEDETWEVFGGWRRGDYFDNENDWNIFGLAESTKTKMDGYYKKYTKNPPTKQNAGYWMTDFADPGKWEWENIIKPFHEKHNKLTESEYDNAWEKERLDNTFTFEAQWYGENFHGFIDPLQPMHQPDPYFSPEGNTALKSRLQMRDLTGKDTAQNASTLSVGDVLDKFKEYTN